MNFTCLTEVEVLAGAKIEPNCLILGDCENVLPYVPKCDAVIADPPYGIGESGGDKKRRRGYNAVVEHKNLGWDDKIPTKTVLDLVVSRGEVTVIWGGNYFAHILPASMGWLYWDKRIGGDFSDGELAWTSQRKALRAFSYNSFTGLKGGHLRQHPTQKPVALMKWCISQCKNNPQTIFDPFMGSGTTCVAAIEMGRKFIGIEREPSYFEIAKRRCEEAFWRCDTELKSKPGEVDLWNFDKQGE